MIAVSFGPLSSAGAAAGLTGSVVVAVVVVG
jgi:hypothetical protein